MKLFVRLTEDDFTPVESFKVCEGTSDELKDTMTRIVALYGKVEEVYP
ncbi:MAG: hypothetical protein ACYTEQ_19505 [Planctomycetota bacterium]